MNHTANSPSLADVQSKVAAAVPGDTVIIPAGSASWSGNITLVRGITIQGPGRDQLTITNSGMSINITPNSETIGNEEIIKITGITFDGPTLVYIKAYGQWGGGNKPWRSLMIGDCRFKNANGNCSGSGAIYCGGQLRGVIYNNIFDRCNIILRPLGSNDSGEEWKNLAFNPTPFGTADQLFFEDNKIIFSSSYNGGCSAWIESGQGGRVVVRYNEYDCANSNATELWDVHGFQNWPGNGQTGTMQVEYYKNTIRNFTGYRWMNYRGGRGVVWENSCSGSGGAALNINQYDESSEGGSGCDAVTGITGGQVNNTHFWGNTRNGAPINATIGVLGVGCGCTEGKAWFNSKLAGYVPYTYPHPLRSGTPPPIQPTEPPLMPGLIFEAEAGAIDAPYAVAGGLVSQNVVTTDPSKGGRIRWKVTIPQAGDYMVKAKVKALDAGADSLFMNWDAEPTAVNQWTVAPLTVGVEARINPAIWTLTAGVHTLYVRGRESDCGLDAIEIIPMSPTTPPPTEKIQISDVEGLQQALDAKSDKGHLHGPEIETQGR